MSAPAPYFDQMPTKPSSVQNDVLRYCVVCKQMKPKAGPGASDPKFKCEEHFE